MADEKQPIKVGHVEDDEGIQRTVARALENGGYSVLTTGSFMEAKSIIPDGIRNVRVAILDNNLGDDDGDGDEQVAK